MASDQTEIQVEVIDDDLQLVMNRFSAMSLAKQPIREIWQGIKDLNYSYTPWIVSGDPFSEPVRFPTLRDVITALSDKYMQDYPEAVLVPKGESTDDMIIGKKAYIDGVKNSLYEKSVRYACITDMFEYGVGFRFVEYRKVSRKYPKYSGGEEDVTLFDDVCTFRADPRDVFLDDAAVRIHDKARYSGARDLIYRRLMPESMFKQRFEQLEGYDITGVTAENYFTSIGSDNMVTTTREINEKTNVRVVKVYEYMNHETDQYIVVASKKVIYKGSLRKNKGVCGLPVVSYEFEHRNDSIWPIPLGELLAPHILLKDTLIQLEVLNLKLTLQPVLAVSGEFGFNPSTHLLGPGQVWQATGAMNGKIEDNIAPIIAGNPNTKFYDMYNLIQSETTITSRSDLRSLEYYRNKTATEVNAQQANTEGHNERIQSLHEIEAEGVLTEFMIEIMRYYMQEKKADGSPRRMKISGYVVNQDEGKTPKFYQNTGYEDFFAVTQDVIDCDCEVEVVDKRGQKAAEAEKLGRMLQAVPLIANLIQLDPTALEKLDVIGIIKSIADAVGIDDDQIMKETDEYEDTVDMYRQEILMGNNVDVPEESRTDSIHRMKMLLDMRYEKDGREKDSWKEKTKANKKVKTAWEYHMDQTQESITRPRLGVEKEIPSQAPQNPLDPNTKPQPSSPGQAAQTPGLAPRMRVAQPDPNLLRPNDPKQAPKY